MAPHVTVNKHNPHSIHNEPFFGDAPRAPRDSITEEPQFQVAPAVSRTEEQALHSVWDEPTIRANGAPLRPDALTYSRWYEEKSGQTKTWQRLGTLILIVLCGGPFAILATLATALTEGSTGSFIYTAVIGPALEEIMKIGVALMFLESRPWLFRSGTQLVIAAAAGGLLFAVVENLVYIYVYFPEGSENFRIWRWTVCTALHTGTSTIAGLGLLRMWRKSTAPSRAEDGFEYQRPDVLDAYPCILTAVIIHGLYNGSAMLLAIATKWM